MKSKVERGTQTLEDSHGPSSRAMRKGFEPFQTKQYFLLLWCF